MNVDRLTIVPYDTTLRDGAQTPGVNLSVENKLRIAKRLSDVGFPFIEGGWPGANPTDTEFFHQAKELDLGTSRLVAFGMTGRVNSKPEDDEGLKTLLESGTDIVTLFGKTWTLHVREALRTTLPKNLQTIEGSVNFLRSEGREIFYDAEHYYDGYRENPNYALETLLAAKSGGASIVILCDTNGGSTPEFVFEATTKAREVLGEDFPLGIHVHNDGGLAVINTVTAVRAGATQVQGTINGSGERAGNVDFCQFLPTAALKFGIDVGLDLTGITQLSRFVELENGLVVPPNTPYVGKNAFRHKGGVHVSAVLRNPNTYQHIDPKLVGNQTFFEHSDQGGGANVEEMARKHGFEISRDDPKFGSVVEKMKKKGILGDAQEYLILHEVLNGEGEPFRILRRRGANSDGLRPDAHIRVRIHRRIREVVAMGNGPVNAFDNALRLALTDQFPQINNIKLLHYTIPSTQQMGSDAEVVVYTEFGQNGERWTSIAKGGNQDEAGQNAIADAYKYYIWRYLNAATRLLHVITGEEMPKS